MKCRDFELAVLSLAARRPLEGDGARQALAHAADCRHCDVRLTEERALASGIWAVVRDLAAEEAPPSVENAVLAAFRERNAGASVCTVRSSPSWKTQRPRWMLAAAAALIMAMISVAAILNHSGHPNRELDISIARSGASGSQDPEFGQASPQSSLNVTSLPTSIWKASTASKPERSVGSMRSGSMRSKDQLYVGPRSTTRRNLTINAEATTDFFPLMDGDDLDSLESCEVVRVELPASVLLAAGLAANLDTEGETVRADVVFAQDGLARAIRFLR